MKNLLKLSLMAVLALTISACDDDKDDTPVDSCVQGAVRCGNGGIETCDGNKWVATTKCTVCEAGVCKDDVTPVVDDSCTSQGSKKCTEDGKGVLTCNGTKYEVTSACANGCTDGECNTAPVNPCTKDDTKCSDDGKSVLVCDGTGYVSKETCADGCDAGKCKGSSKLVVTEYVSCDDEGLAACQKQAADDGISADKIGCVISDDSPVCVSHCDAGEEDVECDNYFSSVDKYVCGVSSDGKTQFMVWKEKLESCVNGCAEDGVSCAPKLLDDQGEDCDPDKRAARCDGNIYSYCGDDYSDEGEPGTVDATDCSKAYDNGICVVLDVDGVSTPTCVDTVKNACESVGDSSTACVDDDLYAMFMGPYSLESTCYKAGDGKIYSYVSGDMKFCQSGACSEDGSECAPPLVEDQGSECTPEDRGDTCDGTILSYCEYDEKSGEGAVDAFDCADGGLSCKVRKSDNYGDCAETCTELGSTTKGCIDYTDQYGVFLLRTYSCQATTDNEAAFFGTDEVELCSSCADNVCVVTDEDKGVGAKEGDKCNLNLFEDRCEDGKTLYCDTEEGVVVAKDGCKV